MPAHRVALLRFSRFVPVLLMAAYACRNSGSDSAAPPERAAAPPSESRTDALLLAAAKVALPPPGINPADLPEPNSEGARLLTQYCTQCHSLPSPAMHSATDWPRVLRRMWLRMERLPDSLGILTADNGGRTTLVNYLTANALRVSGANLPPGPGREDFEIMCSRCHALPDVKLHTSGDWPVVFMRMEQNMQRMNVSLPNQAQTGNILLYLQEVAKAP